MDKYPKDLLDLMDKYPKDLLEALMTFLLKMLKQLEELGMIKINYERFRPEVWERLNEA